MFTSYVLLRHLLYVENRSKTAYFSNIHTPGIAWYMKIHHHIKTNYQYNIMKHTLTFLKNNCFYFRYLLKTKLTEWGFCLSFTVVSQTFPQVMTDCGWEWRLLNDSPESGVMWCIPLVTPVCKHTLRMVTKCSERPKSLLFQDDLKTSVSEVTRTIWDSC